MPLFKALKAPNAWVSINTAKAEFTPGETIVGDLLVTSQEDFVAKEIRVELHGVERMKSEAILDQDEEMESRETRLYSSTGSFSQRGDTVEYPMHKEKTKVSERLGITQGFHQQFPFKITIPAGLGPTFEGMRQDGQWLEREWTLQGVVAIGGRPDLEAEKDIRVVHAESATRSVPPSQPSAGGPSMFCQHCGKPIAAGAVFCNFCGGRQGAPAGGPSPSP